MQAPNNGQQEGQNSDAQVKAANVAQNTETITEVVNIVAETLAEPGKLEALSTQEVEQIFEELIVNDLTPEQADELVETLVKAPKKVKKAFEAKVNIFSGEVDDYVPTNQSIPVSERRTLIAVGNTLGAAGMFIRRRED
jgi:signal recognition particle GTPase